MGASISAIIPVTNRPKLLREAVESVGRSTLMPEECVIVLNASEASERNQDRLAAEAAQLPDAIRRVIVECDRPGPASARNLGAGRARGQWLAFLDSDDLWHPEKLALQMEYLARRPHLRICHTAEDWIKNGKKLKQPAHLAPRSGRFFRAATAHCLISCSAVVIEKNLFDDLDGFDPEYPVCEDFELWLRLLVHHPVGLVKRPLTIKRAGGWPQLTHRHSMDLYRIRALLKVVREFGSVLAAEELLAAERSAQHKWQVLFSGAQKRSKPVEELLELKSQIEGVFREVSIEE